MEGKLSQIPKDKLLRSNYAENLKRLTEEEGIEVLQNLDISENNLELAVKMAEIEQEMEKRKIILKIDPDTKEILKEGKNEFQELKANTLKETRKELTKPSKYVKGAIIAGIIATRLFVDQAESGPLASSFYDIHSDTLLNVLQVTEFVAMVVATGVSIQKTIKTIIQEVKSRVVTSQKVQRILGMMGLGMEIEQAQEIVKTETAKDFGGYERAGIKNSQGDEYIGQFKENIKTVRETLDTMGIKRVSRQKYQG